MRNAIEIHALTKRYGTLTALDEVSFEVGRGELFGLIGPDGAGKTTLFRLLATLVAPDGGTASVDGLDIVDDYKRIRERVGYMPGRFSLYPDLSVGENLAFFAALFGVEIAENYDLIAPIYRQIEPFRARRAGKAFRRYEAEARTLLRADPPARGAPSRRADDGRGRRVAQRVLGYALRVERQGDFDARFDALHGRSGALRPRGAVRWREDPGRRHAAGVSSGGSTSRSTRLRATICTACCSKRAAMPT